VEIRSAEAAIKNEVVKYGCHTISIHIDRRSHRRVFFLPAAVEFCCQSRGGFECDGLATISHGLSND